VGLESLALDDGADLSNRVMATRALGQLGPGSQGTLETLADGNPSTFALAAVRALGSSSTPAAASVLRRLVNSNEPAIASWAADGLGKLGTREAVPSLLALLALLAHDEWMVRGAVVSALGRIGDERTVEPLLELRGREPSRRWLAVTRAVWRSRSTHRSRGSGG